MASSTPSTADTMVTLKVNFQGITRRAKMPLREMIPSILESQIRTFLHIPAGLDTVIERYSDSASTYVILDQNNMAVYKQLYRAAKAKSKLKLRVTIKNNKLAPKPVSVEDEAEAAVPTTENSAEKQAEEVKDEAESLEVPEEKKPQTVDMAALMAASMAAKPSPTPNAESNYPTLQAALQNASGSVFGTTFQQPIGHTSKTCLGRDPMDYRRPTRCHAAKQMPLPTAMPTPASSRCNPTFAICCNNCEKTIPDVHYHCSTCDDGDFDLCQSCVDNGTTCHSSEHWMIKRAMRNGQIVNSTTETIAPKPKAKKEEAAKDVAKDEAAKDNAKQEEAAGTALDDAQEDLRQILRTVTSMSTLMSRPSVPNMRSNAALPLGTVPANQVRLPQLPLRSKPIYGNARTCNCCVEERSENEFLHCNNCEDYDLCKSCFQKDAHGHHPKHSFSPAVAGTRMPDHITVKMGAGRNQMHNAICDGCDNNIHGVRHKCLDCPDWDYCSECIKHAGFVHAKHRFVPVYDALVDISDSYASQAIHMGICCDGPLCSVGKGYPAYIRGIRYKCAICHDMDFCANCEASPGNEHNKTHPLIKFKTPVRNVSVTTSGEHHDGKRMPSMGDRGNSDVKAEETASRPTEGISINTVQTVFDVKPAEPSVVSKPKEEPKEEPKPDIEAVTAPKKSLDEDDLRAVFLRDSVMDGTILPPNHVFEQTWTMRNEGNAAWPAGCSVKFVGGDYMGHVDSAHPADVAELMSASESSACDASIAPGEEFSFTVLLRTPARVGKIISYWRLTTEDGFKFGHRLWCDVHVRAVKSETPVQAASPIAEPKKEETKETKVDVMIFPKLEKESPASSMHEDAPAKPATSEKSDADDFEDCAEDDEWAGSDDGFLTDEEYDILDASDEEFLEEQEKKLLKK